MRIAFAGTPEFALAALKALHQSSHEIVGVLTQPDRPAGRGRKLAPSAIKEYALEHGLELAQPVRLRAEADWQPLRHWAPDVLVVVAYGLILPQTVLNLPRYGGLNIHASLLPRWRGAAPIQRAILAGDLSTGVSIMQMDAGLDTGPVWLMQETPIDIEETADELQQRLAVMGANALLQVLDWIPRGDMTPKVQSEVGVTYAAKIDKAEALIDWHGTAKEIAQKVRAFSGWPVAETRMQHEQWRIHRARYVSRLPAGFGLQDHTPGRLLGLCRDERTQEDMLVVVCGQEWLGLTELQRPGKRRMSARDFVNSLPDRLAHVGVLG